MPPLEVWEKVILSDEAYFEDIHGEMNCIACHGGISGTDDKDAAHEGMVQEPDPAKACDICHVKTRSDATSLHSTLRGFITVLKARSDESTWPTVEKAYEAHCAKCHTTCGQCHVSRPTNLGGGLLEAHAYKKIPPMNLACTGCHGSRVEDEYKGKNEGFPGDVHWTQEGMPCFDCHTAEEMHGTSPDENHRYDGPQRPSCSETGLEVECHAAKNLSHSTTWLPTELFPKPSGPSPLPKSANSPSSAPYLINGKSRSPMQQHRPQICVPRPRPCWRVSPSSRGIRMTLSTKKS